MKNAVIQMLKDIIDACLLWWKAIFSATEMRDLWLGVVIMVALFSIIFVPMRSGQLLGGGAISTFATNQVNKHRKKKSNGDD